MRTCVLFPVKLTKSNLASTPFYIVFSNNQTCKHQFDHQLSTWPSNITMNVCLITKNNSHSTIQLSLTMQELSHLITSVQDINTLYLLGLKPHFEQQPHLSSAKIGFKIKNLSIVFLNLIIEQ